MLPGKPGPSIVQARTAQATEGTRQRLGRAAAHSAGQPAPADHPAPPDPAVRPTGIAIPSPIPSGAKSTAFRRIGVQFS